jgi:hypothetical protein
MVTQQGDLTLLEHPVARELLQSPFPARLAYNAPDGTPRLVPIGFHWNGEEVVLCTHPDAPKVTAIRDGDKVALSIDTTTPPYKVLFIRGPVHTDIVDGLAPEFEATALRMFGAEGGAAQIERMRGINPRTARLFVRPEWVGILDFETRFPHYFERAMEGATP